MSDEWISACPFCGREQARPKSSARWGWFVSCPCHATGPSAGSREGAIRAWNTRVEPLQGRLFGGEGA